jgi:hypothetical protein
MPRLIVGMALAAVLSAGCGIAAFEPPHDRVTRVERRCESRYVREDTATPETIVRQIENNECEKQKYGGGYLYENRRLVVTVRTVDGQVFTAELPPDTRVTVGDRWPLSRTPR